jgi:hypothetical protein
MTGFIIKYVVLLINQKDYEHYLSRMDRLFIRKAHVQIYRCTDWLDYSI